MFIKLDGKELTDFIVKNVLNIETQNKKNGRGINQNGIEVANSTLIGMFFYNYFTAWKQEITEAFKEIKLENKYELIKDRFNR